MLVWVWDGVDVYVSVCMALGAKGVCVSLCVYCVYVCECVGVGVYVCVGVCVDVLVCGCGGVIMGVGYGGVWVFGFGCVLVWGVCGFVCLCHFIYSSR